MSLPSTDPKVLAGLAGCFNSCVPTGFQNPLKTYLLSQLTSLSPGPPNVTNGLVNWWKFDENAGTSAADSAGSNNGNFTGPGNPIWVPGQINSALNFAFPHQSGILLTTNTGAGVGAFTACMWIKLTRDTFDGSFLFDSANVGATTNGFQFYSEFGTGLNLRLRIGGVSRLDIKTSDTVPFNTWAHIVALWDGTSMNASNAHIYINTVEASYSVQVNGSVHAASAGVQTFISGDLGGAYFQGTIDDVRVYNRALTTVEINSIYLWRGKP